MAGGRAGDLIAASRQWQQSTGRGAAGQLGRREVGIGLSEIQFVSRQLLVADVREVAPGCNCAVDRSFPTGCKFSNGDLRFQADHRHQGGLMAILADGSAKRLTESRFKRVTPPGTTDKHAVVCATGNAKDPALGTHWLPTETSP